MRENRPSGQHLSPVKEKEVEEDFHLIIFKTKDRAEL
jgi:hypothetical protein